MKRIASLLLCVMCMLFFGCKSATQPSPSETTLPTGTNLPSSQTTPSSTVETEPISTMNPVVENSGKLRIPYTGNRSSVQYICSRSQLPADPIFDQYNDAFFREHALLLVTETVHSGSIQVSIGSVTIEGKQGRVVLERTMPGEAGTADMATWLLWTTVDAGLDVEWIIENPTMHNTHTAPKA